MSIKRVCYGCGPPDRYPGCHSVCEKYRAEREQALKQYDRNLTDIAIRDAAYIRSRRKLGMDTKRYKGTEDKRT